MDELEQSRQTAIKRLQAKRGFKTHLVVYVLVNLVLLIIWASVSATTRVHYFWPIWILAGWGIGLALHAWSVYFVRPISEDDIRREIERGR